jgi:hypothetical protein
MGPVLGRRELAFIPSRLLQSRDHKYDIRSELGVQSITELLDIYRTNCHDRLLRMEPYRVRLQVYRYRPTGRKMWDDQRRGGENSSVSSWFII